jgi:hypothetical protein
MPATLYNLVNRQHPSIPTTPPEVSAVSEISAKEDASEVKAEETVKIEAALSLEDSGDSHVVAEDSSSLTSISDEVDSVEPTVVYPDWDASWSKTKLLAVAQSLNLSVNALSSKNEIVSALSSATKA